MVKNLPASARNARDAGLIPGLRRPPREGNGSPFQYSCLEHSMDRVIWWATVHDVAESDMTELLSIHTHNKTGDFRRKRLHTQYSTLTILLWPFILSVNFEFLKPVSFSLSAM